jgi:hypothetical protein
MVESAVLLNASLIDQSHMPMKTSVLLILRSRISSGYGSPESGAAVSSPHRP